MKSVYMTIFKIELMDSWNYLMRAIGENTIITILIVPLVFKKEAAYMTMIHTTIVIRSQWAL